MTSIYPLKIPGYMILHDPTKTDFKKISSGQLSKLQNNEIKPKTNILLPRQKTPEKYKLREDKSLSYSQSTFVNHYDSEIIERFQPDYVKLDKQVIRFFAYFKE